MKVLNYNGVIVNVDEGCPSCQGMLNDGAEEIPIAIFGKYPHLANTENTEFIADTWVFSLDLDAQLLRDKDACKSAMKRRRDEFCCAGALVTISINSTSYTAVFHPNDEGLQDASRVAVFRETDATVPSVPLGPFWYCRDESGVRVKMPITEARLSRIMAYVKNWQTECGRVYLEREELMQEMPDVSSYDIETELMAHMPSRSVTVI